MANSRIDFFLTILAISIYGETEQITGGIINCAQSGYLICDDFEDTDFDTTIWNNNGGGAVTEIAGQLNCGTTDQTGCISSIYTGFTSTTPYCIMYKLNASGNNYILHWLGTTTTWDVRNLVFSYTSSPATEWAGSWKDAGTSWWKVTESNINKNVTLLVCAHGDGGANATIYYNNEVKNLSSTTDAFLNPANNLWGSRNYQNTYTSLYYFMAWNGTWGDAPFMSASPPIEWMTINVSAIKPSNDAILYTNGTFNITFNNSIQTNCSFYLNGSIQDFQQFNAGTNQIMQSPKSFAQGDWNYNFMCKTANNTAITNNRTIHSIYNYNVITNLTYTTPAIRGTQLNYSCIQDTSTPYSKNISYILNNTNSSQWTYMPNSNYTVKNTDFLDRIEICCNVNATYLNKSVCIGNFSYTLFPLSISIYDSTNTLLPNTQIIINGTAYVGNPMSFSGGEFLNNTYRNYTATINVTDLSMMNQPYTGIVTFNETITDINISVDPNKLMLYFYQNG